MGNEKHISIKIKVINDYFFLILMKILKTYFTFLGHNKLFTFVNVAGLSISLMFVLLIANMVMRQLTVDKDLPNVDHIYIFANDTGTGGHYNLGDRLQSRYPEIEDWCVLSTVDNSIVLLNDASIVANMVVVSKNFFDFFRFPVYKGTRENLLMDRNNVVLTRSSARKLFGTENAIGKTLKIERMGDQLFTVSGVIEDIDNSVIPSDVELFVPYEQMAHVNWSCSIECTEMSNACAAELFFRIHPGADLNAKADDMVAYMKEFFWAYQLGSFKEAHVIPWREFYFSGVRSYQRLNQYDFMIVVLFITLGVIILLMTVFNYVSMSVAQTSYRAKEMATRRLLGSSRSDIFWRMIFESFLLTAVAFSIAFFLAKAVEPIAMDLLNVKLDMVGDLSAPVILTYLLFVIVLSLLSGFVPATILSSYNPMDVVKGTFRRKTKAVYLRGLNIVQCGLSIAMLTCAMYLSVQIYRILHAPLGYEYGNVLNYSSIGELQALQLFRGEVEKLPFVKRVAFSRGTPLDGGNNNTTYIPVGDSSKVMSFQYFIVDSAFLDIYHIKITEDRHLSGENYFFSENALKELSALGMEDYYIDKNGNRVQIAGSFKDFQIRRALIDKDIHPLQIMILPSNTIYPWTISVEVQDGDLPFYKKEIDKLYSKAINGYPFESKWYGDMMEELYEDFTRINKLMIVFTCSALLISLLGLIAMSIYYITQRKRDIAIRKVFGSSSMGEQSRLLRFSFVSILFSLLIAIPLILIGISQIDKAVTYESSFPIWVPVVAFVVVVVISLGSVWLISMNATRENPVNNLKTE